VPFRWCDPRDQRLACSLQTGWNPPRAGMRLAYNTGLIPYPCSSMLISGPTDFCPSSCGSTVAELSCSIMLDRWFIYR